MEVSWPEYLETTRNMLIQELVRGREVATQLQTVLANKSDMGSAGCEKDLVVKIIESFSNTISVMEAKEGAGISVISQVQADSVVDSQCLDAQKAGKCARENCSSTSSPIIPSTKKNRRGCHARRLN